MKLLRVIGFLLGAIFLLVVANHYFNPNFEADSTLLMSLGLTMFFIMGIQDYQEGRKKTGIFQFTIVALCLILWIASPFMA